MLKAYNKMPEAAMRGIKYAQQNEQNKQTIEL